MAVVGLVLETFLTSFSVPLTKLVSCLQSSGTGDSSVGAAGWSEGPLGADDGFEGVSDSSQWSPCLKARKQKKENEKKEQILSISPGLGAIQDEVYTWGEIRHEVLDLTG